MIKEVLHIAKIYPKKDSDCRVRKFLRISNRFSRIVVAFSVYVTIVIFPFKQQETFGQINFGTFGPYTIELMDISMGDLEFEKPIVSGGGIYEVSLSESFILAIEGVKYLDVGVYITADGDLLLDGETEYIGDPQRSIPFTLQAGYANQGQENIADVIYISVTSNIGDARFPILSRQLLPPGPPPPPPTVDFNQSLVEDSAYLYLYGTIDVGNVVSGLYLGTINVSVQYDNPPTPDP